MDQKIKKLVSYIDDLLLWKKNNPNTVIPKGELLRLTTLVNSLASRSDIDPELWEFIKPLRPEDPLASDARAKEVKDQRIKEQIKDVHDLNKEKIEEIKKLKESNQRERIKLNLAINRINKKR